MKSLLATLVLAGALAASALAAPSLVIRGDQFIGSFAVKKNGTLAGVEKAFGKPAELRKTKDGCLGLWPDVALSVLFYNLAGKSPCKPKTGFFSDGLMTRSGWHTSNGLRIGDTLARLRQLYPHAEKHGAWQWLVVRQTQATGRYAGLSAKIAGGYVSAFEIVYGAGGE